MSPTA